MKHIGAHVESIPDPSVAPFEARALGASAFALNLVNPKAWVRDEFAADVAERFRCACAECGYESRYILPHASFLLNLAQSDRRKLSMSRLNLIGEMRRAAQLGLTMLNFHPGAHLGLLEPDAACALVAESINYVLARTEGVVAVIENTAGSGTTLGYTFEQIAMMIDGVECKERIGVCIDTCHALAAGYDLNSPEGYASMWSDFDRLIGRDKLMGMHINDSMRPRASRIDRHAPIGRGELGEPFFAMLMADSRTDDIPLILETPDPSLWPAEIAMLQAMATNSDNK